MFKKQNGFTLLEVIVSCSIFAIVSVLAASLMVETARFGSSMERENNRAQVVQQLVRTIRNPVALQASLTAISGQAIDCLENSKLVCNVVNEQPFSLTVNRTMASVTDSTTRDQQAITGSQGVLNGVGYYTDAGVKCDPTLNPYNDGIRCPLKVTTSYQVACPGNARTRCPSAQAVVTLKYSVAPNSAGSTTQMRQDQFFAPISGQQSMKMSDLYSSDATVGAGSIGNGATARTSTAQDLNFVEAGSGLTKTCPTGQVMIGVSGSGNVACTSINLTCARGSVFAGFNVDGSGNYSVNCVPASCPFNQVLQGFKTDGSPNCVAINSNNSSCNPYDSSGKQNLSTTQFLTGFDNFGKAGTCHRLTCAPGQITACWINGDAQCADTNFIPRCSNCSVTSSDNAKDIYLDSTKVGLGFEGYPFISMWTNGEPIQGIRQSYRDWGTGQSSGTPQLSGLFGDALGSGQLVGNTCQFEAGTQGGPLNLQATHNWQVLTSTGVYTPPDPTVFNAGCYLDRYSDLRTDPWASTHPYEHWINSGQGEGRTPGCDPPNPLPYPDKIIRYWTTYSETCWVSTSAATGQVYANCATSNGTVTNCSGNSGSSSIGTRGCDVYTNWTVRASCNYYYNKSGAVCGGSPSTPAIGVVAYSPPVPTPTPPPSTPIPSTPVPSTPLPSTPLPKSWKMLKVVQDTNIPQSSFDLGYLHACTTQQENDACTSGDWCYFTGTVTGPFGATPNGTYTGDHLTCQYY